MWEVEVGCLNDNVFIIEFWQVMFYGYCYQKVLAGIEFFVFIFNLFCNYIVEIIFFGCCGMAGFFGYEKEYYELSMMVGEQVFFLVVWEVFREYIIVVLGISCCY